jgi:hypothetical protein
MGRCGMKNGKKPTRDQRKFLERNKLNAADWLIVKDTPELMEIVHRFSDKTMKVIYKEVSR